MTLVKPYIHVLPPFPQFISGGTLDALLADLEEEIPWTLRIKLALDVAKAVRYLHVEGVFHRDFTSKVWILF